MRTSAEPAICNEARRPRRHDMQNPPGSPPGPPSGPPPGQPMGQPSQSSTGMDKRTSSLLAYVLWWLTGIVFLFVGKDDSDVKYHAAQSIVFFGSYSIVQAI